MKKNNCFSKSHRLLKNDLETDKLDTEIDFTKMC